MGSKLEKLFFNTFMYTFEKKHMSRLNEIGAKRWARYIDDIFVTFDNKYEALKALQFMNNQHLYLKFE